MPVNRLAATITMTALLVLAPGVQDNADARCRVWHATHNGSGLFYPRSGGSAGTAANKLVWQVEQWRKKAGFEGVRIGKVTTGCGDAFVKYFLRHKHCWARARVCY